MIRGFARSIRAVVAQCSIVCIFVTGIPVSASAQQQSQRKTSGAPPTLAQMKRIVEEIEQRGGLDDHRLQVVRTTFAIANATSAEQRSALIRALPVSIMTTVKTGGSVVKEFSYRGKVRLSTVGRPVRDREEDEEMTSGPHASEALSPAASELCLDDEEPPCATEEEMDEAAILAAYIEGESMWQHEEVQQELILLACCDAAEEVGSGPRASNNCVTEGIVASGSLLISAAEAVNLGSKVQRARLVGNPVSKAVLSTTGALALGTFLLAFAATTVFLECTRKSPAPWGVPQWFEPVY